MTAPGNSVNGKVMSLSRFLDLFYDGHCVMPLYAYFLARLQYKGVENLESMLDKCQTKEEAEMFVYNNVNFDCSLMECLYADLWFEEGKNFWELVHAMQAWSEILYMEHYFDNCWECRDFVIVDQYPSEEQKKWWSECIYMMYMIRKRRFECEKKKIESEKKKI